MATRLTPVSHRTINSSQSAFMKGRFILDGILFIYEVIHEVKIKHLKVVLFKFDFHKAYDTVHWSFLRDSSFEKDSISIGLLGPSTSFLVVERHLKSIVKSAPTSPPLVGCVEGALFLFSLFILVVNAPMTILDVAKRSYWDRWGHPPPICWWYHPYGRRIGHGYPTHQIHASLLPRNVMSQCQLQQERSHGAWVFRHWATKLLPWVLSDVLSRYAN